MISATCPRCTEKVRVATLDVPSETYAQCPWCNETYPATELENTLPPEIMLMDADGEVLQFNSTSHLQSVANPFAEQAAESSVGGLAGVAAGVGGLAVAGAAAVGFASDEDLDEQQETIINETLQYDASELEDAAESDDFVTMEEELVEDSEDQYFDELKIGVDAPAEEETQIDVQTPSKIYPDPPGVASTSRSRRPKKKSSPVRTIVQIALGAALAPVLAGGILLAAGRAPNLGFWPFDGSFDKKTESSNSRAAAPGPLAQNSDDTTPRDVPEGRSLLNEDSKINQAIQEAGINPDEFAPAKSEPDAGPSGFSLPPAADPADPVDPEETNQVRRPHITDLNQQPISVHEVIPTPGSTAHPKAPEPSVPEPSTPELKVPDLSVPDLSVPEPSAEPNDPPSMTLPELGSVPPASNNTPDAADVGSNVEMPSLPFEGPKATFAPDSVDVEMPDSLTKKLDSPELVAAAKAAIDALDKLENSKTTDTGKIARAYRTIAAVGVVAAEPDSLAIENLLTRVAKSPYREKLSTIVPQWYGYGKRNHDGILLIGSFVDGSIPKVVMQSDKSVNVLLDSTIESPSASNVIGLGKIHSDASTVTVTHLTE